MTKGPSTILGQLLRGVILVVLVCYHALRRCAQMVMVRLQNLAAMAMEKLNSITGPTHRLTMKNPVHVMGDQSHAHITGGEEEYGEEETFSAVTVRDVLGSQRSIELQLLAFMLVFSASSLVPILDLLFPLFVSVYTCVLARHVFPSYPMELAHMEVFHGSTRFHACIVVGTVLAFFLPLAFLLGSFARGEEGNVRAAIPPLFLVTAQMVSEHFVSRQQGVSPPCRVILSLLYSSRRLSALAAWTFHAFSTTSKQDSMWIWFGRFLPIANVIHCSLFTFYFLIPKFLLRAFERYVKAKREYYHHQSYNPKLPSSSLTLGVKKDSMKEAPLMEAKSQDQVQSFDDTSHNKKGIPNKLIIQETLKGKGKEEEISS